MSRTDDPGSFESVVLDAHAGALHSERAGRGQHGEVIRQTDMIDLDVGSATVDGDDRLERLAILNELWERCTGVAVDQDRGVQATSQGQHRVQAGTDMSTGT